jgi:DNA-binding transcriptional LysR family regulator
MPDNPQQLTDMALLNYTDTQAFALWTFNQGEQKITIETKAIYTSNNNYALYQAALNGMGMGIANLYQYLVDDAIKNGRLIEISPQWQQRQRTLICHLPTKTRFITQTRCLFALFGWIV